MILNVKQKQIGKNRKKISSVPMTFEKIPSNMKELIEYTVTIMVESFNDRVKKGSDETNQSPISAEQLDAMADIGRVSFGFIYNEKEQDVSKAVDTAIMAYIDGLVRVFINGELADVPDRDGVIEITDLERYTLDLTEGDEIAFIRLAMLAGRMW